MHSPPDRHRCTPAGPRRRRRLRREPRCSALLWAAEHARRIRAELQVVHVLRYDFRDPVAWAPGLLGAPHTVPAGAVDANKHLLHQLLLATAPEPSWSLRFPDGPAGHTIVDAAAEAQLLFLAEKTIKNCVTSVLMKLGMEPRTQAAVFGARLRGQRGPGG